MITIAGISISPSDIIPVIGWLIAGALTIVNRRAKKLPSGVQRWLKRITQAKVEEFIREASELAAATQLQRQKYVVDQVRKYSERVLGFPVPTSIANLLVEFVYQQWKRRQK